jgi:hypothetical protein
MVVVAGDATPSIFTAVEFHSAVSCSDQGVSFLQALKTRAASKTAVSAKASLFIFEKN